MVEGTGSPVEGGLWNINVGDVVWLWLLRLEYVEGEDRVGF